MAAKAKLSPLIPSDTYACPCGRVCVEMSPIKVCERTANCFGKLKGRDGAI